MKSDQQRSHKAITATSTEASVLSAATVRPWTIGENANSNYGCEIHGSTSVKAKRVVCRLGGPERDANAALIVRAVNNHDALVKALEKCRKELLAVKDGSVGGIPNSICALIPEAIEQADAALNSVSASS